MASRDHENHSSANGSPSPPRLPPTYEDRLTSELDALPELQSWRARSFGMEQDLILRAFGTPGEAFTVDVNDAPTTLDHLRQRFRRRLDLAALSRFPEGYEFTHRLEGTQQNIVVLTPPTRIAVQRADGTWYRRQRQDDADGPAPYTQQWYLEYLHNNNLPGWFLTGESTACLENNAEALWLEVEDTPSIQPPPPRYLEFRYPTSPLKPTQDIFQDGKPYTYNLTTDEQLHVARHFPVTNAIGVDKNYRIYVLPSGHIFVQRGEPNAESNVLPSGTMPWQPIDKEKVVASYRTETTATPSTQQPQRSNDRSTALMTEATQNDGFPQLGQRPQGLGQWEWLEEGFDDVRAREMGFEFPEDVELARQDGLLTHGMGDNAGALTVWYPDVNFFNPTMQPQGPGHWAYHTTHGRDSDQWHAEVNFGNQAAYGLLGDSTPSARTLWRLRQRSQVRLARGEIDADPTSEINLVWIPGEPDPDDTLTTLARFIETPEPQSPAEPGVHRGQEPEVHRSNTTNHTGHAIGDADPNSNESHEPLNRGENDQTGDDAAQYHTRLINGKKFTLDRSRLRTDVDEPHKTWIVSKKGQWQQHPDSADLDRTIQASIDRLQKWRDQAFKRNGWPPLRAAVRETYSDEERAWLFKHVKDARGGRPACGTPRLTADFTRAFPDTPRDEAGIDSLISRLRKEYAANGGEMKERQTRGLNKKKEAEERKRSAEEMDASEEDELAAQPPTKKAARKHDERDGEHDGSEENAPSPPKE